MPQLYCLSIIILGIGVSNDTWVQEDSALLSGQWDAAGERRALPPARSHLLSLETSRGVNKAPAILKGAQGRCVPLLLCQTW